MEMEKAPRLRGFFLYLIFGFESLVRRVLRAFMQAPAPARRVHFFVARQRNEPKKARPRDAALTGALRFSEKSALPELA